MKRMLSYVGRVALLVPFVPVLICEMILDWVNENAYRWLISVRRTRMGLRWWADRKLPLEKRK